MSKIRKNFLSNFHKYQKKAVWSPMLQYFMKDCPLPLTLGNFSDTDTYDLQPLRSYDELFIKEGIEIVVKA